MTAAGRRTSRVGVEGERAAERHLRRRRYRLLARNARVLGGELDLVMLGPDRRTIVVVEVKARVVDGRAAVDPTRQRRPEANITAGKRRQLARLTKGLIAAEGWTDRPVRIDVIAVEFGGPGSASVLSRPVAWALSIVRGHRAVVALRHYENAVGARG